MLTVESLSRCPGIVHGFGTAEAEWDDILSGSVTTCLGQVLVAPDRIVFAQQVHGEKIAEVTKPTGGYPISGADGLITQTPGLFLAVRTADCVPVLLADPVTRVVAAVHSGRMGTQLDIVGKCVDMMTGVYGSHLRDVIVALGPAICVDCYEVDEVSWQEFCDETCLTGQPYRHVDNKLALIKQLTGRGIPAQNIADMALCTFGDRRFFSYRRGDRKHRQVSFIGLLTQSG